LLAAIVLLTAASCVPQVAPSAPPGPGVTVEPNTDLRDGDTVAATQTGFISSFAAGIEITPSLQQCRSGIFPASALGPLTTEFIQHISALARANSQSIGLLRVGEPTFTVAVDAYFTTINGTDVACGAAGCALVVLGVAPGNAAVASAPIAFIDKKK
jgi:hypothetical protein